MLEGPGILAVEDLVDGCHAMTPRYLGHQLDLSRAALGLEAIDLFTLSRVALPGPLPRTVPATLVFRLVGLPPAFQRLELGHHAGRERKEVLNRNLVAWHSSGGDDGKERLALSRELAN